MTLGTTLFFIFFGMAFWILLFLSGFIGLWVHWGLVAITKAQLAKRGLIEREQVNSKGNDETVYLKHVENVIKNKKNRAQLLLDQYNKTNNLDFFKNEKENFNYSGF